MEKKGLPERQKGIQTPIGVGCRIGRLTIAAPTAKRKGGYTVWLCRCDCGGEIMLDTRCLQRQTVTDCGCVSKVKPGQRNIAGMRFGKLTALEPDGQVIRGSAVWRYHCDCGGEVHAPLHQLTAGYRKSCGCLQSEVYRDNLKLIDGTSVTLLEAARSRLISSNTSGHTGVYLNRRNGRWVAQITFKGKTYYLGSYADKEEAILARKRGEELHDDFLEWYYASHPKEGSIKSAEWQVADGHLQKI